MPARVEIKVSKLEGSPLAERGKFAQAYEYTPPEEDLLKRRGQLFVVLDIDADPAFDAALAGKLVWDSLSEEYFSESDDLPLKALERAVFAAKNRLTNLVHSQDELGGEVKVDLNVAAAVLWGDSLTGEAGVLYFVRRGNPSVFLRRAGQVRQLLAGEEPSSVASVVAESGDVVLLGSRDFGKNFTPATLPEVSFLEREFAVGHQVPGLAAILFSLEVNSEVPEREKEKEAEETPFGPGRKLALPSPAGILERLPKKKKSVFHPLDGVEKAWASVTSAGGELCSSLGGRVRSRFGYLGQAVREKLAFRISRGQEIYLERRRPKIGLPKVIALLVLVLLSSVTFTIWRQRQRIRVEEFDRRLSLVEETLDEAEDLIGLSAGRAKELWQEAQEALEEASAINSRDSRVASLEQRLGDVFNLIEKVTPVADNNLFYDLSSQPGWTQALSIAGGDGTIYVSDSGTKATLAIKEVPAGTPQVEEATANKVEGARRLAREGDFLYLLTSDNFYRTQLFTKGSDSPLSFDDFAAVLTFDTYNTNIYFLIPSENQILKFLNLGDEYSRALSWLKEPVVLEGAVDMAIDGAVWTINYDGTVMKFFAGRREAFSVSGLTSGITQPKAIYTRAAFSRLYIAENNRVLAVNKDGQFERQFKGDVFSDLVDLWVTDDETSLFVLTSSKIYKVGL